MIINDITLKNYRSYSSEVFEFGDGVNIIVGPNASGKTNLLEAILVLCTGSSYRARDIDLVSFEQPWARLEADTSEGKRIVTIERIEETAKKKFVIGGNTLSRLSLQKSIPVVVFEPEHLRMLHGGPERRRDYLDELLEQTVASYGKLRRDYRRTLAQRNMLLKNLQLNDDAQLFAWNVRLSELGGKMVAARVGLIAELQNEIQDIYNQLASTTGTVRLEYQSEVQKLSG